MLMIRKTLPLLMLIFTAYGMNADAQSFLDRLGLKKSEILDNELVADGLREALSIGAERAIKHVGKNDGYLKNKEITIPMPKPLRRIERPLRRMGHGDKLDEFELSMNRAAEAAAPLAKDAIIDAISTMTLEDARRVLKGDDTAATDYLSEHTRENLVKSFTPHIRKTMNQYKVTEKYNAVLDQYGSSAFARRFMKSSVEEYTANKALDGLFLVLGQEEKRIRTEPAARTTELLRNVFGR